MSDDPKSQRIENMGRRGKLKVFYYVGCQAMKFGRRIKQPPQTSGAPEKFRCSEAKLSLPHGTVGAQFALDFAPSGGRQRTR